MTSVQISSPATRIINCGRLVLSSGISHWLATGERPYDSEPSSFVISWRSHVISVLLTSHLSGDKLDCCDEDDLLNQEH